MNSLIHNTLLVKGTRDIGGNSHARGLGGGSAQYQLLFLAKRKLRRGELFWLTVTGATVSSGKHVVQESDVAGYTAHKSEAGNRQEVRSVLMTSIPQ